MSVAIQQIVKNENKKVAGLYYIILFDIFFFHHYCYFKDLFTILREILHFLMKFLTYRS